MNSQTLSQPLIKTIAVGSTNPVKVAAATQAVSRSWPHAIIHPVAVDPGVRPQPLSDAEAITGATNRAQRARQTIDADLGIGLEGNVDENAYGLFITGWAAVVDRTGTLGIGGGGRFLVPPAIAVALRNGGELGALMDQLVGEENTKQRQGAVGILTGGRISRTAALESAVIFALTRFLNPHYYAE